MENITVTTSTPDEAPKEWPIALGFLKLYGIDGKGKASDSAFGNMGSEGTLLPPDTGDKGRRLSTRFGQNEIILYPGVYLVSGPAASGKSYFLNALASSTSLKGRLIEYKEPRRASLYKEQELMTAVSQAMADGVELLAIDSLRTVLYASGLGGTAAGGVSMGLYDVLTTWDIFAQRIGMTIMMSINPLSLKDEVLQQLFEASKGSVTAVYQFTKQGQFRYTSRRDPSGERRTHEKQFASSKPADELDRRAVNNIPFNARSI